MKRMMKVAAVALILTYLASTAVMAFGILEGLAIFSALAGKGGKPEQVTVTRGEISMTATPVMALPTGFGFTLQPMTFNVTAGTGFAPDFYHPVFPILKCVAPDGNPIMLVPIDWQPNGKPLQNLLATLDNEPITKTVNARSLVENEGAWLRRAIREANRDLGRQYEDSSNVPDTFFEPFIALSKDVKHSLTRDKRHNFNSPTGSVSMMLVFPMGNLFSRPHFVACNLKQPGKGDNSYNCSFHFRVLDEPVATPAPFESVVPPINGQGMPTPTAQPAIVPVQPSAPAPQTQQYTPPAPQVQVTPSAPTRQVASEVVPPQILEWGSCITQKPSDKPWWQPCYYGAPVNWTKGISYVICFFVTSEHSLVTADPCVPELEIRVNGNELVGSPFYLCDPAQNRNGIIFIKRPYPGGTMSIQFRGRKWTFEVGPPDTITWQALPY